MRSISTDEQLRLRKDGVYSGRAASVLVKFLHTHCGFERPFLCGSLTCPTELVNHRAEVNREACSKMALLSVKNKVIRNRPGLIFQIGFV